MNTPLEYGKYYHIYNRGNNYENIFLDSDDYLHFLNNLDVYINPIADIYAWCLLKNHFHILARIKEEAEIGYLNSEFANSEDIYLKWKTHFPEIPDSKFCKKPIPTQQFKHLFNSYSRWFNFRHQRSGSLFEKNFERKLVENQSYFTNLIVYIHNNPVKHGFVEHAIEYPWSSYLTITSEKPTKLKREDVIYFFDGDENYIRQHANNMVDNDKKIRKFIIE
ncbi:MAG: hypothetical protein WCX31_17625 [Salinivirgaceae bacterium]